MLHVLLPLINVGKMGCVVQSHPFNMLNVVEERLHCDILGLVLRSVDEKRGGFYARQIRNRGPITE